MMRFSSTPLAQYCIPVNKVKLCNQQHHLFCRLAIKETNFVLNCNSSFTIIVQSRRRHWKYDWLESVWIWLAASTQSHKYDWLRLDKIWLAAAAWWRRLRGLLWHCWLGQNPSLIWPYNVFCGTLNLTQSIKYRYIASREHVNGRTDKTDGRPENVTPSPHIVADGGIKMNKNSASVCVCVWAGDTAARDVLRPGDELLTVNEISVERSNHFHAWTLLKRLPDGPVRLKICRRTNVTNQ